MVTAELLAVKLQESLGKRYKIFANDAFNDKFTTTVSNEYMGQQLAVQKSAFEKFKGVIVGVVDAPNATRSNVDFYLINANYTVTFWVPVNFVKRDEDGALIETPKFNFYGDIETFADDITNKQIEFYGGLYGRMTISEPRLAAGGLEDTGSGKRKLMSVTGAVTITDKGVFGADKDYYFETAEGVWTKLEGVSAIDERTKVEQYSASLESKIDTEFYIEQKGHTRALVVANSYSDNAALRLIKDAVFHNKAVLSPFAEKANQHKIHVTTRQKNEPDYVFWAIPEITYTAPANSIGTFSISLLDDGKGK